MVELSLQGSKAQCATQREFVVFGFLALPKERVRTHSRPVVLKMNLIASNIQSLKKRIAGTADACGRSPREIMLLAISKKFPKETIYQAVDAGLRQFGENRVQEAEGKIPDFPKSLNLEWHLVGHLQSNKARRAAELFDMVHSVDSAKLAAKLNQACLEIGKTLPVLLQVDLGDEESKFGVVPNQIRETAEAISGFKGIRLDGLMTIPPFFEDTELVRPYFVKLREWRDRLESEQPGCLGRQHLSMGMSHDFEVAIQEGATIVRVGTGVFGPRG
jgi:pyridoxal phosphate enzyme (YggS family)